MAGRTLENYKDGGMEPKQIERDQQSSTWVEWLVTIAIFLALASLLLAL